MKIFKNSQILMPEEKKHYVWIFLFLFSIVLFQFLLFPNFRRIHHNREMTKIFQKEIKEYEKKTTEQILGKDQLMSTIKDVNRMFADQRNVNVLINQELIRNFEKNARVADVVYGKRIRDKFIDTYPLYIELTVRPAKISTILKIIEHFPRPIELERLQIDGLPVSNISVKIQLLIKDKRNN